MRSRFRHAVAVAVAVVLSAWTAHAQINPAHLTGTAKDAQGAVLPGVTVTATSPALLGNQTVTTEANGDYRFPSLPAGTYALSFELQGFQTFKRTNIVLVTGQTLTIDAVMQIASLQESVTVTSQAPVVDTQSTSVGYVQSLAQLKGVPTSTDLWGALAQTPGVRMQGVDVGGSHKSQQSGYDAFGITNQVRVVTDGIDTTEGSGGAGFYQDYFAQNEIAVGAAGQDVSMNTPGAAVLSTIKSGGNKFSGLENIAYEPGRFVGTNTDSSTAARGDPSGQPNLLFWEGHADLGGPVLIDKLWFYAAANHFKINKAVAGVPQHVATDLGLFKNYTTKETYKPSTKDTIIGYYQWAYKVKPLRGIGTTTPAESALAQYNPLWMFNGRWQRTWSNRLFTEINIGQFGYIFPEQPNVSYVTNPPRHDLSSGVDSGAGWFNAANNTGPFVLSRGKPQAYATVTYFLPTEKGSHDLKFGFEFMNDRSTNTANGTSGPILYQDRNGATSQVRITDYGDPATFGTGWTQASDYDRHYTLYAQDRWTTPSRLTFTFGVRYDYQRPYYSAAVRNPLITTIFQPTTVPGATLLTFNNVAPRAGVSWDAAGDGTSVIKAFYGRYYFNAADNFANADPGGPNYRDYTFNDANGDRLFQPGEQVTLVNSAGGASTRIDPGLKNSYVDEVDLSYDRQFWAESAFRVAYVRKMERNLYTAINTARIGQYTVPTTIPVTIQDVVNTTPVVQNFTVNDIPASLAGVVNNVFMNIPDSLGGANWTYDTFELAFNKRFGTGLFLNSNFDYQWRKDIRNPAASNSALSSDPITPIGAAGSIFFAQVYTTPPLQSTTVWDAKVSARYQFKYDIGVAANYSAQAGWPYARTINVSLKNSGSNTFFLQNLSNNRADTISILNLRLDKGITISHVKLTAMFDLFNVLNTNAVTNFNIANGSRFNQINATVDPRTAQVSFRVEF